MNNQEALFEVVSTDSFILQSSQYDGLYAIKNREKHRIILTSLSGQLLTFVDQSINCGPGYIKCRKLPSIKQEIPKDSWQLKNSFLKIPGFSEIDLKLSEHFESDAIIQIRDFPGRMKRVIASRLKKEDCAFLKPLDRPLHALAKAVCERDFESASIPVVKITGYGYWEFAAGDAALCGMLLTARCFALGGRFGPSWIPRLSMEIRRFLFRTGTYGRYWVNYAISGRMTEKQQEFFRALAKDGCHQAEETTEEVARNDEINGLAFLAGVNIILEMIQEGFFSHKP